MEREDKSVDQSNKNKEQKDIIVDDYKGKVFNTIISKFVPEQKKHNSQKQQVGFTIEVCSSSNIVFYNAPLPYCCHYQPLLMSCNQRRRRYGQRWCYR